ncbi:MAG: zf-TFIIB domain-containing protein [Lentisphaeraceae bacterium]|nr:zf-TFIIB domain-containing protein [Lentisphaeraceae bacterium]
MKCTNCAAPIPANSLTCPYCSCRAEIDLKGMQVSDKPETKSLPCPHCNTELDAISLEMEGTLDLEIERCNSCHGLFFDPGELEFMLDHTVKHSHQLDPRKLDALSEETTIGIKPNRYIKCPHCSDLMNYYNYGGRSGVIIDWCRKDGIWLDGGELRRLLEWKKLGGEELKTRQEEMRAKERNRKKSIPLPSSNDYDEPRRSGLFDLDDIVEIAGKLIRIMLR